MRLNRRRWGIGRIDDHHKKYVDKCDPRPIAKICSFEELRKPVVEGDAVGGVEVKPFVYDH